MGGLQAVLGYREVVLEEVINRVIGELQRHTFPRSV
jgi:hypothetical protein